MKVFKGQNKTIKKETFRNTIVFTIVFILFLTSVLLFKFSKNISKNITSISEAEINNITYRFITDRINHNILNKDTLQDILIITKNKNDEILYVDFNYDNAYKILDSVSKILTDSFDDLQNGEIEIAYYDREISHKTNGLVLSIPIGSTLNNSYFYNLGPKIPVKVNFVGSVLTNLQTKVTNYGMNNALVEVFVYMEFHNKIMAPFSTKDMSFNYDAVIASKMIQGSVPDFYSGEIIKTSEAITKDVG